MILLPEVVIRDFVFSSSAFPSLQAIQDLLSSTDIQIVKPEFIHEGNRYCCPIPRDASNIKSSEIPTITAIDGTQKDDGQYYDQSVNAQKMMKGEFNNGKFTHISIPFSLCSPMKGVYICLFGGWDLPEYLIFTLTSSKGEKTSKKYEFTESYGYRWYFLLVDLPDVVLCEITGKGREEEYFSIQSPVFIRQETSEEIKAREAREKLWSDAPVVKAEFVKKGDEESRGRDSIPIPRDDPKLVAPSFSMVKCKNDAYSKESKYYDKSSEAQRMLKGEDYVFLSHLSVPFLSPSPMKGAYIYVNDDYSSPFLLFTFTDCDGKKTCKKYEFTEPKHDYEWHFLPIDLDNVVLCEIEGKGSFNNLFVFLSDNQTEILNFTIKMSKYIKTLEEFKSLIAEHHHVIIYAYAEWSGPCKRIAPVYHSFGQNPVNSDIIFCYVDVDEESAEELVADFLGVRSMPTFISFRFGNENGKLSWPSRMDLTEATDQLQKMLDDLVPQGDW
ncbi:hypothetical protein ADUPG1_012458 [Aduncisulcus paluster]|uniref:Thioredoxin domain-containing protein n=1 Tax=Aduncisulcus paluster TaxID=2918883 RepID=A0ABQ5K2V1_9EUKA|nr:hypothetical protein ADUPG1_012458 [Aduncisulcus paluster]